jgi:hypothetical protein
MTNSDTRAFAALFKDAYLKCFGQALESPLSETESKLFCNHVLDRTGLSIGWKSVKNYSFFIIDDKNAKTENPSAATLDTLARFVLGAPYTTEIQRKNDESHYPYWFLYKEKFNRAPATTDTSIWRPLALMILGAVGVIIMFIFWVNINQENGNEFTDNFKHVSGSAMAKNGWFVKHKNEAYWNKNNVTPGQLTLYTLKGDNWPDPANKQDIENLLLRPIPYDCFTAEVHLGNFIPQQEWQQAGILLLEDTTLAGKSIRLSIAYNDYFAGSRQPKEIYIQAVSSLGHGFGKPEEFAHKPITYTDSIKTNPVQIKMLQHSALRIEKQGKKFRFLFSDGITENTAFKEVVSQDFDMQPKYIGIFAIRGFKDSAAAIPVHFTFFRIAEKPCR